MPQTIPGGSPGAQPAKTPSPISPRVNYNFYDSDQGRHVYDQNWRYLRTDPNQPDRSSSPQFTPNFGGETATSSMGRSSSMMASPEISPEPTPIPGNFGPGAHGWGGWGAMGFGGGPGQGYSFPGHGFGFPGPYGIGNSGYPRAGAIGQVPYTGGTYASGIGPFQKPPFNQFF